MASTVFPSPAKAGHGSHEPRLELVEELLQFALAPDQAVRRHLHADRTTHGQQPIEPGPKEFADDVASIDRQRWFGTGRAGKSAAA